MQIDNLLADVEELFTLDNIEPDELMAIQGLRERLIKVNKLIKVPI